MRATVRTATYLIASDRFGQFSDDLEPGAVDVLNMAAQERFTNTSLVIKLFKPKQNFLFVIW